MHGLAIGDAPGLGNACRVVGEGAVKGFCESGSDAAVDISGRADDVIRTIEKERVSEAEAAEALGFNV